MKKKNIPNHSIKLEELAREITENIGNHKALDVFPIPWHAGIDQRKTERAGSEV